MNVHLVDAGKSASVMVEGTDDDTPSCHGKPMLWVRGRRVIV